MKKHILILLVIGLIAFVVLWRSRHVPTHSLRAPMPLASQSGQAAKVAPRATYPIASGQTGPASTAKASSSPTRPSAAPSALPRRLADITLSPAAEKEIEKRESEYFWPAQYRETLNVKLEVFARMAECMEGTVPFGQADVKLYFDPIPGNSKLVVTKAELRGNSLPKYRDYLRAKTCVETGLIGIDEPLHQPELTQRSIMYVDVHFPIDSNPLYELLRSGVEPEIEDLTEAQYQQH